MRTFCNEFSVPLDKVERVWIRIPATIILSIGILPLFVVVGAMIGALETIEDWWEIFAKPCWKGKP